MSFDFSTLITDRTQADVTAKNDKGTYNADDLNRVTAAMEYLDDTLRSYGYVTGYQRLEVPHDTTYGDSLLPDGYTELSYIQSSGTQYIDSGFIPNQDTRLEMVCSPLSVVDANDGSGFIPYGAGESYTSRAFECYTANSQYEFNYDGQYGFIGSTSTGQKLSISHNKNEIKLIIDGSTTLTKSFNYQSFTAPYTMTLFAIHRSSVTRGLMKLYACKIYDNGTLVRDFVPCISDSGDVGLYDIVEEQFYANAGTGVFTAGDVVDMPITGDESDTEYDSYTWYEYDLPTKDLMAIYLANVLGLYDVILSEPELPTTMEKLTYHGANKIEQALVTLNTAIKQIVAGFARSNSFTFWSGNRPFPTAQSERGRNWAQLDAMETSWSNWQAADWYLLLYGNLKAEGDVV